MSVRTMAKVWDLSQHRGNDLLMLLAIADFADDDGNAYPSVQTLAKKCRMKARNTTAILTAIRKSGELEVRPNEGPRGTNRYRIVLPGQPPQEYAGVQNRAGVQKRAAPPAETCRKPLQNPADEPSVNHQEPSITRNAEKPPRVSSPSVIDSVPSGFAEFWSAYDKKVGKSNSLKEWAKVKPDADLVRLIVSAAKVYSSSKEQQYRKDPERWLKGRMWQDEGMAGTSEAKPDWMAGAL